MWNCYSASQKGNKLKHETCQDYYNEVIRGDVICVVVCDGASSGVHSELGAELISKFLSEYFAENFDVIWNNRIIENQSMIDDLHGAAIMKLSEFVVSKGYAPIVDADYMVSQEEIDKYCTTVQLIAIKNDHVIIFKVGNGSIAYIEDNKIKLLSESEHNDLTPHFTYKNTIDTVINSQLRKYTITDNISGFIIMSDGVDFEGGMYYNGNITNKLPILVNKLKESTNPLKSLVDCISNISKHQTNISNDDITISILLRGSNEKAVQGVEKIDDEFSDIVTLLGKCNDSTSKLDEAVAGLKKDSASVSQSLESQQSLLKKCCEKFENLEAKTPDILDIEKNYIFKRRFIILSILAGLSLVVSAVNLCLDVFCK